MKKVKWRWDYGVYAPFCPYCDDIIYDNKEKCAVCGKPYEWVEPKYKDTVIEEGEYTIIQATNKHITIYQNGELILHAHYTKKLTCEELRAYLYSSIASMNIIFEQKELWEDDEGEE